MPFDFKRAYARLGPLSPYAAQDIPTRLRSTDLVHRFETGQIEPEQFVQELAAVLEFNITYAEFCELWSCVFLPETLVPDALIASLATRYRLLVLSNTNAIHFPMLRSRYPILGHFHGFVLS